jgi:hypothetical protein
MTGSKTYHNVGAPNGHTTFTVQALGLSMAVFHCACSAKFSDRPSLTRHVELMAVTAGSVEVAKVAK